METSLENLKNEVLNCKKCSLYKTRKNPVFGEGNLNSKIMFVGEAPGYWEDIKGIPFCGAAGEILDELLKTIGLERKNVFIANLLKCRPPENRDPKPEEILICTPFLEKQIKIIKPKIICPLGRYSMKFIFEKYNLKEQIQPISEIHGKIFEIKDLFQDITIIPLYHPAVATYNPYMKKTLEKDFKILEKFKL